MVSQNPLLFFILLLLSDATLMPAQPEKAEMPSTAYEVLQRHGLPIGLLPKGVIGFRIDGEGRFEVHLEEECTAKFEYEIRYSRNVSGSISYGQIASISGVSAQELFLWFPVRGIRVDIPSSGLIYFDVGVIYKQFSLSLFETPPYCSPASRDPLSKVVFLLEFVIGVEWFVRPPDQLKFKHSSRWLVSPTLPDGGSGGQIA